mmetsp:Transcript_9521/g.22450  ORF Transcript_9521/g.22450 Transcript_9521/m.22450 type:complete len:216 (-) Transcript_9521:177-824(-)|eukprot:CAMPEP_0171107880 /NCGR_PEP_ID=MMETSP0766_2-20121228/67755_1 /TAXON_ID=439317 /ORGANISM="Gambierdiscus australes, Strain CAWD 149" /LENGTH=215 /DNA_ID=CAMNT_0011569293 /DNA_START=64 /DNA_END=711 /DNA_ORIENTATION=+
MTCLGRVSRAGRGRRPLWQLPLPLLAWYSLDSAFVGHSVQGCRRLQRLEARGAADPLTVGQQLSGTVKSIGDYGATIDIEGSDTLGWLHVSELQEQRTEKVEDVLSVGDAVELRIKHFQRSSGEPHLTMRDLPQFAKRPLSDFSPGDNAEGTVVRATKGMAYLDIGAMVLAGLGADQVQKPMDAARVDMRELFSEGQKVAAKVLEVGRQISLTTL